MTKHIKIEIDGVTYAGFLQEVKESAAATATPNKIMTKSQFEQFLKEYVSPDILEAPDDIA